MRIHDRSPLFSKPSTVETLLSHERYCVCQKESRPSSYDYIAIKPAAISASDLSQSTFTIQVQRIALLIALSQGNNDVVEEGKQGDERMTSDGVFEANQRFMCASNWSQRRHNWISEAFRKEH